MNVGKEIKMINLAISALKRIWRNNRKYKIYLKNIGSTAKEYIAKHQVPPLSEKEKAEIDAYWSRFGVQLDNYDWHRMYYDVTGKKDPRFIPSGFGAAIIYPYYNDRSKTGCWEDKNYYQRFLPQLSFPVMLGQKINWRFYDKEHNCYLPNHLKAFCEKVYADLQETGTDTLIIKKTVNTAQGKGVSKYRLSSAQELVQIIEQYRECPSVLIQMVVKQHPFFSQFNESSVNIIRITTWRKGTDIKILAPCIRFGIPGSHTDIAFVEGHEVINAIGIQPDGRIMDYSVTLDGEKKPLSVEHPNVPNWEQIKAAVKEGHQHLEQFGIVAWDVTVDADGRVIIIEYNLTNPGMTVYQMIHGPFAGDDTDDFLQFLLYEYPRTEFLPGKLQREICK